MKIRDVVHITDGEFICCESEGLYDIKKAFCSDLMSDVLAYADEEVLLVTALVNNQVIRTAEMMDLKAILFVQNKIPSEEVVGLAQLNKICLIRTRLSAYEAVGRLFSGGLLGIEIV